ncbi:DUF6233 domain-containing protein [Streptomyces sp. MBT33]|uniref:DUF6233 domain-containing protein n=1 Tax=Streptomyces sp. MBT33 TaxID=1488363 RepID=UPI00190CAC25|nr:DUF6233 domain-containing protein [Streptomyces sp. MBT33]MBK3647382.1 hypothetical protein [Streptomyces sp. MBT33]
MSALPPDAPRLRAILAFLEQRIADNQAVGVYLRLQRDAVREALARAEGGGRPARGSGTEPPRPRRPVARDRRGQRSTGFVVQRKRTPDGPEPAMIHTDDCTMIDGPAHPVRGHEARAALTEPDIAACTFCRPDTELGVLE